MAKARAKINEEFKNHKVVKNEDEIAELMGVAKEVEFFYRTRVVQAVPTDDGKHSEFIKSPVKFSSISYFTEIKKKNLSVFFTGLRITQDTDKVENVEYDPVRVEELSKKRPARPRTQCCQEKD